ncbi:hypothetical protein DFH06DRAFT_1481644 [Mycena polygramma]|nr:hypothetical protein DFH06DRAFT_1481644 [Mycena polygramma]
MSATSFDVDDTFGALLIGTLVSYVLFGVATTQAHIYWGRFPDDSRKMKAMVVVVWCFEFAHAICIGHTIYTMVITNFGRPNLVTLPASLITSTVIGSLVSWFIQSFFAFRIYTLSQSLWIPCICWAMSLFRLVPANVVMLKYGIHLPLPVFLQRWGWLFDTVWAVSAFNDLLIAGSLVYLLYQRRAMALKNTVAVLDKMIAWTIETGVVTSIASLTMMSVFVSTRSNFIWTAIFIVIPRLFSNSFFASLNSRAALRLENDHDFALPRTMPRGRQIATFPRPATHSQPTTSLSIHMSKTTMTDYSNSSVDQIHSRASN